ncbi:MAG: hypothetical protein FWF54_01630 [Candidatus Azobacteroides sp.]|nr:hypothetical protein [Candidatus Azobacteroides sp.]
MKKTRFCHSVWTKPMSGLRWYIEDQLKNNLWLFALSVAYVKKSGHKIVLHTDSFGKEIYGQLPYDEIYLTLDHLDVHERFWAAGKIYAQEAEPIGSVHIDGDVFLKKQAVYDIIGDRDVDLIVQMIEGNDTPSSLGSCYEDNMRLILPALNKNIPPEFNILQNTAYNCGLIKFNNPELKKRYIEGYKTMIALCSKNQSFVKRLIADNNLCPDIVMEQWWLKSVVEYYGYKIKTVLPEREKAETIGYTHLIGKNKYDLIPVVKERLSEISPDLYVRVDKIISRL